MERIEGHDIRFYERDDNLASGKILAKMEDPPVEGVGENIAEALEDLTYELHQFSKGVADAIKTETENL